MKTTAKTLRKLITDEKAAHKDYAKRGFKLLARQEAQHAKFLKRKLAVIGEIKRTWKQLTPAERLRVRRAQRAQKLFAKEFLRGR